MFLSRVQDVQWACDRYNYLMKGVLSKPGIHIGTYGILPICFRKLVVGHQVAWGQAFQFSRGGPSLRSFQTLATVDLLARLQSRHLLPQTRPETPHSRLPAHPCAKAIVHP